MLRELEVTDEDTVLLASTALIGLQGLMVRALRADAGDNGALAHLAQLEAGRSTFRWDVVLEGQRVAIKAGIESHGETTWLVKFGLVPKFPAVVPSVQ